MLGKHSRRDFAEREGDRGLARSAETKKRARKSTLKNRYFVGSKLSEHKFLRILRGYAEGKTIQELERTTHVSGKSIRATYALLRQRLPCAVQELPESFGMSGTLLAQADELLANIIASRSYRRYKIRHAPRMSCPEQEAMLITEFAVRLLCSLDLRHTVLARPDCKRAHVVKQFSEAIASLHPRARPQRLAELIPGARSFVHPEQRLFEDFRRFLLKNPLGSVPRR